MNWKMCVSCERCGHPDHQSSAPLGCREVSHGIAQSFLCNSSNPTSHLHSRELPMWRARNCIKHLWCSCQALVSKYPVLQRTPVCFFLRCKASNELLWFYIRQPWFDSQEYTVIVLAIILPLSHLRPLLDESCYLKCPPRQLQREKENFCLLCHCLLLSQLSFFHSDWPSLKQGYSFACSDIKVCRYRGLSTSICTLSQFYSF